MDEGATRDSSDAKQFEVAFHQLNIRERREASTAAHEAVPGPAPRSNNDFGSKGQALAASRRRGWQAT